MKKTDKLENKGHILRGNAGFGSHPDMEGFEKPDEPKEGDTLETVTVKDGEEEDGA